MAQSKEASSRPELLFLDFDIDDLKGPKLPTNGDMLRYYFNRHHASPKESIRSVVREAVSKCLKIWNDNGIATTSESYVIKILEKMLLEFKRMMSSYKTSSEALRRKKTSMWRQKYELLFFIAARDAHEKCSVENREKLLAAKKEIKEFGAAVKNNTLMEEPEKKSASMPSNEVKDDSLNNNEVTNPKKSENKINSGASGTKVKPKPKAFKQLDNNQAMSSPNQNLREQLKQQGWVYVKNKPTWKLAVVVPPSSTLV